MSQEIGDSRSPKIGGFGCCHPGCRGLLVVATGCVVRDRSDLCGSSALQATPVRGGSRCWAFTWATRPVWLGWVVDREAGGEPGVEPADQVRGVYKADLAK